MTITKKHLKELADICYMAQHSSMVSDQPHADLETISNEIKSFAKRHAPNFDESRWRDYLHKKMKADDKPEPYKQYRLIGKKGESSIARGNTWAESEIK